MRNIFRVLLLVIAVIGVGSLAYYSYTLNARTLKILFPGAETQYGNNSQVVFQHGFALTDSKGPLLDIPTLKNSLRLNGTVIPFDGPNPTVTLSGNALMISVMEKFYENDVLSVDSEFYNKHTPSPALLPKDFRIINKNLPSNLSFTRIGLPRDGHYSVETWGNESFSLDDIRYYVHYNKDAGCNAYNGFAGELIPVSADVIAIFKKSQITSGEVAVHYDTTAKYVCLVGGLGRNISTLEMRSLSDLSMTGVVTDMLSPEFDMRTRVSFQMSTPFFADTGAVYSEKFTENRTLSKVKILNAVKISPFIPLTVENIEATPDRFAVTAEFVEGQEYTIDVSGLQDVFGRKASYRYTFTPKKEPFLSLQTLARKSHFSINEDINVKVFALQPSKKVLPVRLCRVPLGTYAKLERIVGEGNENYRDSFYDMSKNFNDCISRDVVLPTNEYVANIDTSYLFPSGKKTPGLYVMFFANRADIEKYGRYPKPLLFSIMDHIITMKLDANGKSFFLVTDIQTGAPIGGSEITIFQNIGRTYEEKYNQATQKYEKHYFPVTSQVFSTGIILGKTDANGKLIVNMRDIEGGSYSQTFENWWSGDSYNSFIVQARKDNSLGYVVSTWNDSITGWNFGLKEDDYSYYGNDSQLLAYLHTDRRLYLPGDTVHIHAILRKKDSSLSVAAGEFQVRVVDSMSKEIKTTRLKTNEFGTLSTSIDIPKDASLGAYSVSIMSIVNGQEIYLNNGYSSFQVEVFKNPTFSLQVDVTSGDTLKEGGILSRVRVEENANTAFPWYTDTYKAKFDLQAKVKATYYNGAILRNTPFTYRIYRSPYYANTYWDDCFWGCYYDSQLEVYTEGSGVIDSDGMGLIRVPVDFESYYDDYTYTAEITVADPLSSETVSSAGSMVVRLPENIKPFSSSRPLIFSPEKRLLKDSDTLSGSFALRGGKWEDGLSGKYEYSLVSRTYSLTPVEDMRVGTITTRTPSDRVVVSGEVQKSNFSYSLKDLQSGEYHMIVKPKVSSGATIPDTLMYDTAFYIEGNSINTKNQGVAIIPEKTIYNLGDTAKVLITTPFTGAHLLITREKNGVVSSEYITLSGTSLVREYRIDDTFVPNSYLGVIAYKHPPIKGEPSYAVAYAEIITSLADKKANLTVTSDKTEYKNRDTVKLNFDLKDRNGKPRAGELAVMVIDESLIALLGNIDLDIIPKFYQKILFTTHNALSLIGIERNRFLSRRGAYGGSGNKGGDGISISTRVLFKNTAYYNPSIRVGENGKAEASFPLPDNVTNYRIITIANTKDSLFAVNEKTIPVRRDYTLEVKAPMIVRRGDDYTITTSVFNSTKNITDARVRVRIGSGTTTRISEQRLILNPGQASSLVFSGSVFSGMTVGDVPYVVDVLSKDTLLDSILGKITYEKDPILENRRVQFSVFDGRNMTLPLTFGKNIDINTSRVHIAVAPSPLLSIDTLIAGLLSYPHGCIEQTVSSTLPNALALNLGKSIGASLSEDEARKNLDDGVKRILSMQLPSGHWEFWQGDGIENSIITPYIIRSLVALRELGTSIPNDVIARAGDAIVRDESVYSNDMDRFADATWALAILKSPNALAWKARIDTSKLSRYGYISYANVLRLTGGIDANFMKTLKDKVFAKSDQDLWYYWSDVATKAMYTRLLISINPNNPDILPLLESFLRDIDGYSYYVSTQEKIQVLLAFADYARAIQTPVPTKVNIVSDKLRIEKLLSSAEPFIREKLARNLFGKDVNISKDSDNKEYVYMTEFLSPLDPYAITPVSHGMKVERTISRIDETKGTDTSGKFLVSEPMKDMVFERGKLYEVKLTVTLTDGRKSWYGLTLEDYFPGAWRPIQAKFLTSSKLTGNGDTRWQWSRVESAKGSLLITADYGYDNTKSYTYYIRPEFAGTYMLPPATAYFMYKPSNHSYTGFQKIAVR